MRFMILGRQTYMASKILNAWNNSKSPSNSLIFSPSDVHMKRNFLFCLLLSTLCYSTQAQAPKYEFRGAWIATVKNIDWPSRPGLHAEFQQAEFIELLDTFVSHNLNAVIVQIRPAGDALYPSAFEPWSEWLSVV